MKKLLSIVVWCALSVTGHAVTVETTTNLNVYYPEYTKVDLVCGQMPKVSQKDVEFCCEAAFTGELLNEFKHSNIADNHICNGEMKKSYRCKANTGGFVWGNGKWKFMRKTDYPTTANGWNMGFCQLLIIKDGAVRPIGTKMKNNRNIYRALCEKDGKLCIIESKKVMTYEFFVKCLSSYKVTYALYLDMGRGWNYAWYRDKDGKVKEIFPESKFAPSFKYRTNWITFYKREKTIKRIESYNIRNKILSLQNNLNVMKRIRIFISSVQSEFVEERTMLSQYIRTDALLGKFFETFIFEDVPANEASPQQVYLSEVEMMLLSIRMPSWMTWTRTKCTSSSYWPEQKEMLFRNRLEVWNPGQLPYGLTVNKLLEPHKSLPANPLIADPLFWTGYVDKVGTGTEDIVNLCKDKGLKSPEYHQEEDFRVVIWRRTGNVTGNVTGSVAGNVASNVKRIVLTIGMYTLTRDEIMQRLGLKGSGNFRATYLYPAIEQGYVAKLYPESDKRPDQAYYLTEKGKELLKMQQYEGI